MLISPEGKILYKKTGEGILKTFEPLIEVLLDYYGEQLNADPLPLDPLPDIKPIETSFRFPSKLCLIEGSPSFDGPTLAVSDSGNNRVVFIDLNSLAFVG